MTAERCGARLALLLAAGCAQSPPRTPGASLVEVVPAAAAGDYAPLGDVSCRVTKSESRDACISQLKSSAWKLGADVVVLRPEKSYPDRVELAAVAYRRQLPWQKEQPRSVQSDTVHGNAALSTGTGFVVAADGTILTAHHVVKDARSISVSLSDGRQAAAVVSSRLADKDLVVLKVNLKTPSFLTLGNSSDVKLGQRVWTLGYPVVGILGFQPKYSDGSISALSGLADASEAFQVAVPIQPGNSGGPLLTDQGLVVGVITSTAAALPFLRATGTLPQGINWAVKSDYAKTLISNLPAATPESSSDAAVERTKAALCLVESVEGEGLLVAQPGFGKGLVTRTLSQDTYDRMRARCDADNAEACMTVAIAVLSECSDTAQQGCSHARFARTVLNHACEVGRRTACSALASKR